MHASSTFRAGIEIEAVQDVTLSCVKHSEHGGFSSLPQLLIASKQARRQDPGRPGGALPSSPGRPRRPAPRPPGSKRQRHQQARGSSGPPLCALQRSPPGFRQQGPSAPRRQRCLSPAPPQPLRQGGATAFARRLPCFLWRLLAGACAARSPNDRPGRASARITPP